MQRIRKMITVANGKGGAGKTSMVGNLADLWSAGGLRVLAVDLDPQGNLTAQEFNIDDADGKGLFLAVLGSEEGYADIRTVRPNLDVFPGGAKTAELADNFWRAGPAEAAARLGEVLSRVEGQYDLILVDTPPAAASPLADAAIEVAGHLLIPTKGDDSSIAGILRVGDSLRAAKARGAGMPNVLGVLIFGVGAGSTRLQSEVRSRLHANLQGVFPVLDAFVIYAERAAIDQRAGSWTLREYADRAKAAARNVRERIGSKQTYSANAAKLAESYHAVALEIQTRMKEKAATHA